jgi:hypothetical protein
LFTSDIKFEEHGIKIIGDKGVYNSDDLQKIERKLSDGENELQEDFFDSAETNQDINIYPDLIGFEDNLENIGTDLDELRKNQPKDLIPESMIASALNIYIENALEVSKKNNMIDVSGWDILDDGGLNEFHSGEERRLLDQKNKQKITKRNDFSIEKQDRDKGLLSLAENNELFHIDLNNIYESVGETQVKNFAKLYGAHHRA